MGVQSGSPALTTFRLNLHFESGTLATYSGQLVPPDTLRGTWTQGAQSVVVTFRR
jgi:hypothetical protein